MVPLQLVEDFLAQKRFAFVGVSREAKDFSRALFREFRARGYDAIPVHPSAGVIEGVPCADSLDHIRPPVQSVLFMTPPLLTEELLKDCAAAGVRRVWIYRASPAAVEFCRYKGISLVHDECPFMFFPKSGWFHRFHGFLKKMSGTYPS
jgi:predicted CoA-binding protein